MPAVLNFFRVQLDQQQQQETRHLISQSSDIFSHSPGVADLPPFSLDTGQAAPIQKRPYRPALAWKQKIETEIDTLLAEGIIQPSTSPWASPLMAVPKKNGEVRICIDFRAVNSLTTPDPYPLPRIDDLLATVASAKYLTTLDLTKGYHQILLTPESIPKTAFTTHHGRFEYTRLPFGLSNAPAHFQKCMDQVFKDLPITAYLDDVVIATSTWKEHITLLRKVFQRCRQKKLTLKLKKCCFTSATLKYLGHVIGSGMIAPLNSKIQAVLDFPAPKSRKQLKSFLGLTGYYRDHIPNYSKLAAPLDAVTGHKSPAKVVWNKKMDHAFHSIKDAFKTAAILSAPDLTKPFTLTTDACATGVGATLTQENDGQISTITFYSKKLSKPETAYSATELEGLAIAKTRDI